MRINIPRQLDNSQSETFNGNDGLGLIEVVRIATGKQTAGKLIDNQILLEGLLTMCLYTYVEENKDGTCTYNFVTNRFRKFPAKTPDGMFADIKIPNNLQQVADTIDEYYK